ncbi:hypothetical protein [Streptomyces tanashiensis]|uniref:Lipoprotein n=1 Tax=Streptomyces tanashiensis TaxID=67367 RepID=A0ABY6QRM7_9ACTN|nr:hypothetical protein [Streptomyces tanashiensis]UZX20345.1 hypothetical protein LDH80_06310 [Streptomyces tanashiensis]
MPWNRTTSLVAAAVAVGLLGLTACGSDAGDAKGTSSATAPAPTTPDAPPVTGGVKKPDDLPAGLPLPSGELTSVTGGKGAYVLTFSAADPKAAVGEYRAALEGAGYQVVDVAGIFTATSDKTSVSVATSGDTMVLTLATL